MPATTKRGKKWIFVVIDTSFNSNMQMMMLDLIMKLLQKQAEESGVSQTSQEVSTDSTLSSETKFSDLIEKASQKYNIDADLISAVIKAESNYNSTAVSSCGAQGLMQLMPGTAAGLGVTNSFDPAQNIDGGVKYLRNMLNRYGGDVELALAAYNAGPGAVDKYDGIPPYKETQAYVSRILSYYED